LYIGDVIFAGRVPFVGNADIKKWISTLDRMMKVKTKYLVPGHGGASEDAKETMTLTYEYLNFLIDQFTPVVEDMEEFDTAYQKIDWSKYENLPAFEEANRRNAYSAFLYLERTLQ
jgi:glyoxylase-like metal-dependent hydrolase (beta-lactamase superfamily II)